MHMDIVLKIFGPVDGRKWGLVEICVESVILVLKAASSSMVSVSSSVMRRRSRKVLLPSTRRCLSRPSRRKKPRRTP